MTTGAQQDVDPHRTEAAELEIAFCALDEGEVMTTTEGHYATGEGILPPESKPRWGVVHAGHNLYAVYHGLNQIAMFSGKRGEELAEEYKAWKEGQS